MTHWRNGAMAQWHIGGAADQKRHPPIPIFYSVHNRSPPGPGALRMRMSSSKSPNLVCLRPKATDQAVLQVFASDAGDFMGWFIKPL